MNKFIWYFYNKQEHNHENLKLSTLSRMFYLATYMDYTGTLRLNNKRILERKHLQNILKIKIREMKNFVTSLKNEDILFADNNKFTLNSEIVYKGLLKKKSKLLPIKSCTKINIEEIRFLYENCDDSRRHKILGRIFDLIPFLSDENTIYFNNTVVNWDSLCDLFGYNKHNISTFKKNLLSFKLSNGENLVLWDGDKISVNENFVSNKRNMLEDNIDLNDIQKMIDRIREKNENEDSNIYVINIDNSNYYKIGTSMNVDKRLLQLQTSNPEKLTLIHSFVGGYKVESYLQKMFKNYNVSNEWFNLDENYVNLLTQLI